MNIVKPSYEILGIFPGEEDCLQWLERIGRTCYKSEDKITAESAPKFVRSILKLDRMEKLASRFLSIATDPEYDGPHEAVMALMEAVHDMLADPPHESVIEHSLMTVRFVFDRGISHEMVRHRLCAFSQESTRYCNYGKGDDINFIKPPFWPEEDSGDSAVSESEPYDVWEHACLTAESDYNALVNFHKAKPEQARSVLPNSLKTEIVVSTNFREWRHIFRLRTSKRAHPQIREVMVPLLKELKAKPNLGLLFSDIEVTE